MVMHSRGAEISVRAASHAVAASSAATSPGGARQSRSSPGRRPAKDHARKSSRQPQTRNRPASDDLQAHGVPRQTELAVFNIA